MNDPFSLFDSMVGILPLPPFACFFFSREKEITKDTIEDPTFRAYYGGNYDGVCYIYQTESQFLENTLGLKVSGNTIVYAKLIKILSSFNLIGVIYLNSEELGIDKNALSAALKSSKFNGKDKYFLCCLYGSIKLDYWKKERELRVFSPQNLNSGVPGPLCESELNISLLNVELGKNFNGFKRAHGSECAFFI